MANDFEGRLKAVEEREAIMYTYIDELRAMSLKLDREHEQTVARVAALEERAERFDNRLERIEELLVRVVQTQDLLIERVDRLEDMMGKIVETQRMIVKLMDHTDSRLDGIDQNLAGVNGKLDRLDSIEHKLDDLLRRGTNGHS
jgi:chromosome segregation ATPase